MNGRCGQDKRIGEFTFKNLSVIDYSIASALKFVNTFNIHGLDCLFSDRHSFLSTYLNLKISDNNNKNNTQTKVKSIPKWNEERKSVFLLNINQNKIREINNQLHNLHQTKNVNKDDINQICTEIGSLFTTAAEASSQT